MSPIAIVVGAFLFALLIGVIIWLLSGGCGGCKSGFKMNGMPTYSSTAGTTVDSNFQIYYRDKMRALWAEHVTYTRLYMLAFLNNAPAAEVEANKQRLLRNPTDMGTLFAERYGNNNQVNNVTNLLTEHLVIAAGILDAVKTQTPYTKQLADWYTNASQLAAALAKLNPLWPEAALNDHIKQHLALLTKEILTYNAKDYNGSIAAYDESMAQAYGMADILAMPKP